MIKVEIIKKVGEFRRVFDCFWWVFGGFWRILKGFGGFRGFLKSLGGFLRVQEDFGGFLEDFGRFWRVRRISEGF